MEMRAPIALYGNRIISRRPQAIFLCVEPLAARRHHPARETVGGGMNTLVIAWLWALTIGLVIVAGMALAVRREVAELRRRTR